MAFYVGQKVVCIDDAMHSFNAIKPALSKGTVYTIAGLQDVGKENFKLVLAEQPGQDRDGNLHADFGYRATRFRPLIEKSTDAGMSILREILIRETITDKPRLPARTQ